MTQTQNIEQTAPPLFLGPRTCFGPSALMGCTSPSTSTRLRTSRRSIVFSVFSSFFFWGGGIEESGVSFCLHFFAVGTYCFGVVKDNPKPNPTNRGRGPSKSDPDFHFKRDTPRRKSTKPLKCEEARFPHFWSFRVVLVWSISVASSRPGCFLGNPLRKREVKRSQVSLQIAVAKVDLAAHRLADGWRAGGVSKLAGLRAGVSFLVWF